MKFIKARMLDQDGDLVWGILEVSKDDKRKAFDPNTQRVHNSGTNEAQRGNPMASKPSGDNDIEVVGI